MRRTMVGLVFSESPTKKKRNHHRDLRNRTFSGLNTLEDGMRELPITSKLIINVDCSAVHKLCPTGYTLLYTSIGALPRRGRCWSVSRLNRRYGRSIAPTGSFPEKRNETAVL